MKVKVPLVLLLLLDLELPGDGPATLTVDRGAMQAWLDSNAQHKHGAHKYSLADFGLDKDEVDQRLMFYRERFAIPYETKNPHLKDSP